MTQPSKEETQPMGMPADLLARDEERRRAPDEGARAHQARRHAGAGR
jgi:hypothetical protein